MTYTEVIPDPRSTQHLPKYACMYMQRTTLHAECWSLLFFIMPSGVSLQVSLQVKMHDNAKRALYCDGDNSTL